MVVSGVMEEDTCSVMDVKAWGPQEVPLGHGGGRRESLHFCRPQFPHL